MRECFDHIESTVAVDEPGPETIAVVHDLATVIVIKNSTAGITALAAIANLCGQPRFSLR